MRMAAAAPALVVVQVPVSLEAVPRVLAKDRAAVRRTPVDRATAAMGMPVGLGAPALVLPAEAPLLRVVVVPARMVALARVQVAQTAATRVPAAPVRVLEGRAAAMRAWPEVTAPARMLVAWGMAPTDRATATVMAPAMVMAAAKEERAAARRDLDLANDI